MAKPNSLKRAAPAAAVSRQPEMAFGVLLLNMN
jgi:hypothetical protein